MSTSGGGVLLLSFVASGAIRCISAHRACLFVAGFSTSVQLGFTLIKIRWRFNLQLSIQVVGDIAFMVTLMHASGGISSGLGLLLLATLAGAGLISRGRLSLFYAALASIAVLLEHTYAVLRFEASSGQFVQAGLLSVGYFATALLAYTLARYAAASEQLAAQREVDLENWNR